MDLARVALTLFIGEGNERERFGEEKWKGKGERAEREALVIRRYPGRRVLHGGIQRGGSGKWQLL